MLFLQPEIQEKSALQKLPTAFRIIYARILKKVIQNFIIIQLHTLSL